LRSSKKVEIAVIGGSGLEKLFGNCEKVRVGTPYGLPPPIFISEVDGKPFAFLPRHGLEHSIPPHKINYRANIYALYQLGVKRILATNAVGAINLSFKPGDLVVPHDFIDFTKRRDFTFYEDSPVTHVDFSQPYCPQLRSLLIKSAKNLGYEVGDKAVLVCTEGPRFETPAEVEMFRRLGCDIVGMTSSSEAVLSRELEICYATLCYVSNMAAGIQRELTVREVGEVAQRTSQKLEQILRVTIRKISRGRSCPCSQALKNARYE